MLKRNQWPSSFGRLWRLISLGNPWGRASQLLTGGGIAGTIGTPHSYAFSDGCFVAAA